MTLENILISVRESTGQAVAKSPLDYIYSSIWHGNLINCNFLWAFVAADDDNSDIDLDIRLT